MNEFLALFPEYQKMVIDGIERPPTRPKQKEQQRKYYSGKKKRHTMKNTVVADPRTKRFFALTVTTHGSIHDKKDIDNSDIVSNIPDHIPIKVDLVYQGLQNEYVEIIIPQKKSRNGELPPEQTGKDSSVNSQKHENISTFLN